MQDGYGEALVCRRGHVASRDVRLTGPEGAKCTVCGADILSRCSSCDSPIQGEYFVSGVISFSDWSPADFCHVCGALFPWSTWGSRVLALENVAEKAGLDAATKMRLTKVLRELAEDGESFDVASEVSVWSRVLDLWPGVVDSESWPLAYPLISNRAKLALDLPDGPDVLDKD